ncbi:MAG TPA: GerMN domain-containing protein [Ilumatobacteraceae bacterium]|nr:GerMN domain-containing protein [Ilumatobacteraceae bacterium]
MRTRSGTARWLGVSLFAVLLGACGVTIDDAPRNIPDGSRRDLLVSNGNSAGPAVGSARIYLRAPTRSGSGSGLLRSVPRGVEEIPLKVLTALLAGPNDDEVRQELTSAIPRDTQLLSSSLTGGVLTVDVSGDLSELTGATQVEAVAQIVLTATEITGVQSVRILLSGTVQDWPDGAGILRSTPLTKYDFPGFVESAQPDFPPIPTPTQG